MIHCDVARGGHFAAAGNGLGQVLVQLGDAAGEQVRLVLTPEEANSLARLIAQTAWNVEQGRLGGASCAPAWSSATRRVGGA